MNIYEQFLVEKVWKMRNWCQEKENKGKEFSKLKIGGIFGIISFYFHQTKLDFCICFFNCQSFKCGQLSHNYIKRDLDNPNYSSTTIVIPVFSWATSGVHIFKLRL